MECRRDASRSSTWRSSSPTSRSGCSTSCRTWDHILGNMLFLAVFGRNVEDAFGHLRYLVFYFAGGFVAMMAQTLMTVAFSNAADGRVPNLGASGAIAAV